MALLCVIILALEGAAQRVLMHPQKAHGSSKDGQSASADVVFAPPCPEPQKSTDPVRQPGRAALQEQSISSSSRRSTPSASTMPPAEGHTKHEKCGSTERRVSKSTSRLRSGTPTSADIAAQHCPQTGRSAPAGRCPSSEISNPESGRPSGRPSAFAAAASAQEHANLHVAPFADPQPALKELQTQPGQTPFAAAALAQSSPRSAEKVSEAPAALDASAWALTEAPAAMCAAAAPRSRSAGPLRGALPRQRSAEATPSHERGGQAGQRMDFLKALEEACRQDLAPTNRIWQFPFCIALQRARLVHGVSTLQARLHIMPGSP